MLLFLGWTRGWHETSEHSCTSEALSKVHVFKFGKDRLRTSIPQIIRTNSAIVSWAELSAVGRDLQVANLSRHAHVRQLELNTAFWVPGRNGVAPSAQIKRGEEDSRVADAHASSSTICWLLMLFLRRPCFFTSSVDHVCCSPAGVRLCQQPASFGS